MSLVVPVAVVGLGSVGKTLLRLMIQKETIFEKKYEIKFQIVIAVDSSGIAADSLGIQAHHLLQTKEEKKFVKDLSQYRPGKTLPEILDEINCKILFEASPVNLKVKKSFQHFMLITLHRLESQVCRLWRKLYKRE